MQNKMTFEPKDILCPIDFSELSDLALKYAAIGAHQYKSNLTVLHAERIELPRYFFQSAANQINKEIAAAQKGIRAQMARHVKSKLGSIAEKLSLKYKAVHSHPVEAILDAAENGPVDLIVLGTHGYGGMKRLLLGSVAKGVLENTKVAVFSIRQKQHDFIDVTKVDRNPQIKNILCPSNTTIPAELGLRYAASLSERFHASLTVLNIYEGEDKPDVAHLSEELCDWISRNVQAKCELKPIVLQGYAAEQIIDYAQKEKSDLIVLSARHHRFRGGTFFGRTTELVVRHAPVPVLTAPIIEASLDE